MNHARIFSELGANVASVLCATKSKAEEVAKILHDRHNIVAEPFDNLNALLAGDLDAVSICTPPKLHMAHMIAALNCGLPVFCEKPMIWDADLTETALAAQLRTLQSHPNRHVFVNTSNLILLEPALAVIKDAKKTKKFTFCFATNGPYTGLEIAIDLLPHGLSLLLYLFGEKAIEGFSSTVSKNQVQCQFAYGGCMVNFEFEQDPLGPRNLQFELDGHRFTRVQLGAGATYSVRIRDERSGRNFPVMDPFKAFISRFLSSCLSNRQPVQDDFEIGASNMRLMNRCIGELQFAG